MGQATNTIYGDLVATETVAEMKRRLTQRAYAMNYLHNVSKYAKKGTKVIHLPDITTESAQSVAIGATFSAPSGGSTGTTDLTLDKKTGNPFNIQIDTGEQTLVNILKEKSAQAAENILETMDVMYLAGLVGAVPVGGKANFAGASTKADTLTLQDFINADQYLNEKKAPISKRFCFISPTHKSQIFGIESFISADKIGKTSKMPLVEGFVGRLMGFDVIILPWIPKVDKAGAINATAAKNDSFPVLFGHELCYMWGKQLVITMTSENDLATSRRYVPANTHGHAKLIDTWVYQISDKTTADPS